MRLKRDSQVYREHHTKLAESYGERAAFWVSMGIKAYADSHARIAAHNGYLVIGRGQGRANLPMPVFD